MQEQVEERLKFYETGDLPRKNLDVMEVQREEGEKYFPLDLFLNCSHSSMFLTTLSSTSDDLKLHIFLSFLFLTALLFPGGNG